MVVGCTDDSAHRTPSTIIALAQQTAAQISFQLDSTRSRSQARTGLRKAKDAREERKKGACVDEQAVSAAVCAGDPLKSR